MPSLVYACKFHISSSKSMDDVLSRYADWISTTYSRRNISIGSKALLPESGNQLALDPIAEQPGHRYKYEGYLGKDNSKISLINWSYPSTDGQRLIWKNSATV